MQTVTTIVEVRQIVSTWKKAGKTIGLVPTMGALHEGHQSLITTARQQCDKVVLSIFVNPLQFSPEEDLACYPRDLPTDQIKAAAAGCDLIFCPSEVEMYPAGFNSYVECFGVTQMLEGHSRPTHFKGVTTVVAKLFGIVTPDIAFFGQKDTQQVAVIEQMVRDLNLPVTIYSCPIIREASGLAKSSRNQYLSVQEKKEALVLSQSLKLAERMINTRQPVAKIHQAMTAKIEESPLAVIDYLKIVNPQTLQEIKEIEKECLILLAVYIGQTRLIDNARFTITNKGEKK
ncbi:pantoate--beta-alanine ligase [Enterococcus asini]|uniref:pantoate--beta-alanine ligase n=1 Tax=Enterococcus asini TaxID=57732 RepID=UPI002891C40D|nr:pantoate--beta-alanine ligase [Enterococcus asini]MDT2757876.1 pantoate--beta-alanine ligase [Enterococcus asini]